MQINNLDLNDLLATGQQNDEKRVSDALGRLLSGAKRAIDGSNEPDELVKLFDMLEKQLSGGRADIRSNRPIATLNAGEDPDRKVLEQLRTMFDGNMDNAVRFVTESAAKLQQLQHQLEQLAQELRAEKEAHELTKQNAGTIDGGIAKERDDLRAEVDRLTAELNAEKARTRTTPVIDGLVSTLKGKGKVYRRGAARLQVFAIPLEDLSPDQKRVLGVKS